MPKSPFSLVVITFLIAGSSALYGQKNSEKQLRVYLDSAFTNFHASDAGKTLYFAEKAEKIARKVNNEPSLLKIYYLKGSTYFNNTKPELAEREFIRAEKLAMKLEDTLQLIEAISGQSDIKAIQGENLQALFLSNKAKELAQNFDQRRYHGILLNIAFTYRKLGQFENALSNMLQAQRYFEEQNNKSALAIIYNNLGELYRESLKKPKLAKKHFFKAIAMNIQIGDDLQLSKNYNNLGLAYGEMEDIDSALYYLHKAKNLKERIADEGGKAISHYNLGNAYLNKGDYNKAIANFEASLEIAGKFGIDQGIFYSYHGLGKTYMELGNNRKALDYLKAAQELARTYSSINLRLENEQALYEFYKNGRNYAEALYWLEEVQSKQDSINSTLRDQNFNELRIAYEKELSEAENKLLRAQRAEDKAQLAIQSKTLILYILLAVFLFVIIIILMLASRQKQKVLKAEKKAKLLLKEQYSQLKQQKEKLNELNRTKNNIMSVIGHDLRSPLSSILSFMEVLELSDVQESEKKEILSHLKNETALTLKTLENILAWSRLQMNESANAKRKVDVTGLVDEIRALYAPTARLKKIDVQFEAEPGIMLEADEHQLRSVISNLLSNALKFSPENDVVVIELVQNNDEVELRIADNGKGIHASVLEDIENSSNISTTGTKGEKGTGIGLKLVKEFAEQNNGELFFEQKIPYGTDAVVRFSIS